MSTLESIQPIELKCPIHGSPLRAPTQHEYSRNLSSTPCTGCGKPCFRKRSFSRTLWDLSTEIEDSEEPVLLNLTYSQHYCCDCRSYFLSPLDPWIPIKSQYTQRVIDRAVSRVVQDRNSYREASRWMCTELGICVPFVTIRNWVTARAKRQG